MEPLRLLKSFSLKVSGSEHLNGKGESVHTEDLSTLNESRLKLEGERQKILHFVLLIIRLGFTKYHIVIQAELREERERERETRSN